MLVHTIRALGMACFLVNGVSLAPADDPFVGKWKLNQAKSKVTGQQLKIEAFTGNRYRITFGPVSDTLIPDGTDQPVQFGRTRSLKPVTPDTWKLVSRKDGRTVTEETWKLSPDGRTLTMEITGTRPDGSTYQDRMETQRVAGTCGFAGTWESTKVNAGSPDDFEIQPYEGDGLSFITPSQNDTLSMRFDGKDYPVTGPNVAPGATSSGRRVNERTLELTDKVNGKVVDTMQYKVSPDSRTLTLTDREKGQSKPAIFVYEKK